MAEDNERYDYQPLTVIYGTMVLRPEMAVEIVDIPTHLWVRAWRVLYQVARTVAILAVAIACLLGGALGLLYALGPAAAGELSVLWGLLVGMVAFMVWQR